MIRRLLISGAVIVIAFLTAASSAHAGYRTTLAHWTKRDSAYAFETLDARLVWRATLLSDEMVSAQGRLLEKKRLNWDLIPKGSDPRVVAGGGIPFFVALYTHGGLKDFSLDRESTWKIFLVGADGKEAAPEKIEPITPTSTERIFYPYLDRWSKPYIVVFPLVDLGEKPELVLRSLAAESRLRWKMK